MRTEETDVLIVGGGPCGLAAAIALGRLGVETLLVERHATTSYHPRGHVVNARTMEILRTWGLEAEVRALGIPHDRNQGVAFVRSVAGETIGELITTADVARNRLTETFSPSGKTSCPQDLLEPVLRREAERHRRVCMRFGCELVGLEQDASGVVANLTAADGSRSRLRACYAIAADGARSPIRDRLDVRLTGDGPLGNQIGVYFAADLSRWVEDRPRLLWWIYNATTFGVLIALDGRGRWTYNFAYDAELESPESYTPQRCEEIVRAAIGVPDLPVEVRDVRAWRMQARIVERLRVGRVFFAGDAAHPLPPTGGQGMNTAVGDVQNLAWKLALVLRGVSNEALLDTYDAERKPVIRFNVEQSVRNARRMENSGLGGIMQVPADLSDPDIERMRSAIEAQRDHFDYPGQTFGYRYASCIVQTDDSAPAPAAVGTYVASAAPGSRAPHVWLSRGRDTLSTIDLFVDDRFTLLAGRNGAVWCDAYKRTAPALGLEAVAYTVGPYNDLVDHHGCFLEQYGIGPDGAVLVRPDGHVAWRSRGAAPDPAAVMRDVVRRAVEAREPAIERGQR